MNSRVPATTYKIDNADHHTVYLITIIPGTVVLGVPLGALLLPVTPPILVGSSGAPHGTVPNGATVTNGVR